MLELFAFVTLVLAVLSTLPFSLNVLLFRTAPACESNADSPPVRQLVGSFGEALRIPLMYIILLTYLPFLLILLGAHSTWLGRRYRPKTA